MILLIDSSDIPYIIHEKLTEYYNSFIPNWTVYMKKRFIVPIDIIPSWLKYVISEDLDIPIIGKEYTISILYIKEDGSRFFGFKELDYTHLGFTGLFNEKYFEDIEEFVPNGSTYGHPSFQFDYIFENIKSLLNMKV